MSCVKFLAGAGMGMLPIVLPFVLALLRRKPYYLSMWVFLVVNLTGASGLLVWLCIVLGSVKDHMPGAMSEEAFMALLLAGVAAYLLLCAVLTTCVFPPRAVWERRAVIRAVTIALVTLVALAILQDRIVSARFPRLKRVELGQKCRGLEIGDGANIDEAPGDFASCCWRNTDTFRFKSLQ